MPVPTPAVSDADKARARYHMGYLASSFAASMQFGIPRPVQTVFLAESAFVLLNEQHAIDRFVLVLDTMDAIEDRMRRAALDGTLAAEGMGPMRLRGAKRGETYPDLLEREYVRWGMRLADILGAPLYPYSGRYNAGTRSGAGMIPRRS